MSEPLSCVRCGAPRTKHICAYCGARYSAPEPEPAQIVGDLIFSYRDEPGAREVAQAMTEKLRAAKESQELALAKYRAQYGLYNRTLSTIIESQYGFFR